MKNWEPDSPRLSVPLLPVVGGAGGVLGTRESRPTQARPRLAACTVLGNSSSIMLHS
jgi:hypothetical protein